MVKSSKKQHSYIRVDGTKMTVLKTRVKRDDSGKPISLEVRTDDFGQMEKVGQLLESLAASGKTVLVATHDPELIELCCDYILCIETGKVACMKRL